MPNWRHDFEWGRQFVPELKRIAADHLIGEAPFCEDAERATDLIVLKLDAVRVACRVRRHHYLNGYGDQFTLRLRRDSGAVAELPKVLSGFGDYLIYGFADESSEHLVSWLLGDLSVFRLWFARTQAAHRRPFIEVPNGDGTHFAAFRVEDLPDAFTVARSDALKQAA